MKKQINILAIIALFAVAIFIGACGGSGKAEAEKKAKEDSIKAAAEKGAEMLELSTPNLILGKWSLQEDPAMVFEFTKDGKCMQYENGKLGNTATYEIKEAQEGYDTLILKNKDMNETYKMGVNEAELTIIDKDKKMIFTRKME